MKQIFAALLAALMVLFATPSMATITGYNLQSDEFVSSPLICAGEEGTKKKKAEEEEEPECD